MTNTGKDITRTPEMDERYKKHKENNDLSSFVFDLDKEEIIKDFKFWVVITNAFPYDGVLSTHHMLVPKRYFAESRDMNSEERNELENIKDKVGETYDGLFENFTHKRSVPVHFHIHLVEWKHWD